MPDKLTHLDHPTSPGVYIMKDDQNRIIYVGKAGNIRKRLGAYFRPDSTLTPKTRVMMTRVSTIDSITTLSEKDALLLESSLIKKHRPKYNIVLRDDKQYILFRLDKSQDFPALELTRKAEKDSALYFGPFTSGTGAKQTLAIINKLFLLRKCGHKKFRNRIRPCLQYFIKRCLGPCCMKIDRELYHTQVRQVELFLSGKSSELLKKLKSDMLTASETLDFERAAIIRDQIRAVNETVKSQSMIVPAGSDMDVFELQQIPEGLCTGVVFVRQGKVLDNKNFFWPGMEAYGRDETEKIMVSILSQFYGPERFIPEKVVLPMTMRDKSVAQLLSQYRGAKVSVVKARGEILNDLLSMAGQNSIAFAAKYTDFSKPGLARLLKMDQEPVRIECVDISHFYGSSTRAGSVVFEHGRAVKSQYRLYKLHLSRPGDDYQALRGFISRRMNSGLAWPDVLLIDGGPGQLGAVTRALEELGIKASFQVLSIAKGPTRSKSQLHDRVYVPGRKNPLPLKAGSPELLYLQKIRDQAHDFVLASLRKAAGKNMQNSILESIPGIGPKKAKALWEHFRDMDAIKSAGVHELAAVPGFGPGTALKTIGYIQEWKQ